MGNTNQSYRYKKVPSKLERDEESLDEDILENVSKNESLNELRKIYMVTKRNMLSVRKLQYNKYQLTEYISLKKYNRKLQVIFESEEELYAFINSINKPYIVDNSSYHKPFIHIRLIQNNNK